MDLQQRPAVIVLVGKSTPGDLATVKKWLKGSRFETCEAGDIFQAIEKLSDFTVRERPEVVLLELETLADVTLLTGLLQDTKNDVDFPVFTYSGSAISSKPIELGRIDGSIAELSAHLEEVIPQHTAAPH